MNFRPAALARRGRPVSTRHRIGILRPGSIELIRDVADRLAGRRARRVTVVCSPRLDVERLRLGAAASVVHASKDFTPEQLQVEPAESDDEIVIGIGGGSAIDAAKIVSCSDGVRPLILVPLTLSGAEHSAIAAWMEGGLKRVMKARPADAVISDPQALITDPVLLRAGAMHGLAHGLAVLGDTAADVMVRDTAASGIRSLVTGIERLHGMSGTSRMLLARGLWLTSVALMATGPRLNEHHVFVHQYARAGEHVALSATALRAGLEVVHNRGMSSLAEHAPTIARRLRVVVQQWNPPPHLLDAARWEGDRGGHSELIRALARLTPVEDGGTT